MKLFFPPQHEKLRHAFAKRYGRSAENLFWNEAPLIIQVIPVWFSATEFPFHRLDNRIPLLTVQDLLRIAANKIETNVPFLWQESRGSLAAIAPRKATDKKIKQSFMVKIYASQFVCRVSRFKICSSTEELNFIQRIIKTHSVHVGTRSQINEIVYILFIYNVYNVMIRE